jgi:TP901 family phage tail tape measure protein
LADVGEIRARLVLTSDQFNRGMQDARTQMDATGQSARRVSKDIDLIQQASLALGGALAIGVGAAVTQAANYEQALKNVEAVSGSSADEMARLSDVAKELGASTQYSSTQVVEAAGELIKAGLTMDQVIGGGLVGALDLATAGELQLAEAAEIASTALNAFKDDNLSVSDAANILSGAANASATDVSELKFGLSAVSAVASSVGMTFQDTATALAVFAQNGIKGSDSGTSLKTMLSNLQPTTEKQIGLFEELGLMTKDGTNAFYTQEGQIKSLAEIAGILRQSMGHMTDQQRILAMETIFGSDAIRASNILYKESAEGVNAMWDAMSNVKAADVAKVKMDTLKGAFNEFQSTLENLGITVGSELLPEFTQIVRVATEIVRELGNVDGSAVKVGIAFVGITSAIGIALTTIAKLSVAMRAFALTPAGAVITALSVIGGLVAATVVHQKEMNEVTLENANAMLDNQQALEGNIEQYDNLRYRASLTNDELARFVDINSLLSKTADPKVIAALTEEQAKLQEKSGLSNEELNRMVELNGKIIEAVPQSNTVLTDQGNVLLENTNAAKKYNAEQMELIRLELEAQKAKAEASMEKNLIKEKTLLEEMKTLKTDMNALNEAEIKQHGIISGLERELAIATANNDTGEINRLNNSIAIEKQKHQIMKDQVATQAELVFDKSIEIDKIQAQIGKLDEVKRKMIDLEMKQAGINAKRGEEVSTIALGLAKLEAQKRKLEETTPVAQRNSGEYAEAVQHIENQITELNTVKSRIYEITGAAGAMNAELGKQIRKDVIIRQVGGESLKRMPDLDYHTGGITGRGQMPTLHTGGLASQFADMPSHNEVDVRLLRNEMVLTEAQQANLMRMIDAGMQNKPSAVDNSEVVSLLKSMDIKMQRGFNSTVVMQEREVARIIEPYVSEEQARNKSRKERF